MGWTCSTEKERSQHSIGFRAPTVHRHWGGEAPHGDREGCRDESAYRLMKDKARTQNGVESILCSAKEISCLQWEREIWEEFQEKLGKGCGHRQSWGEGPPDAGAAVKAPTGKRRLDSGDTSHPVWLKGGR